MEIKTGTMKSLTTQELFMQKLDALLSPARFEWGCATSAFQIEGASRAGGKLPSIWDDFCTQPGRIKDGSDGTIACDHFHRFGEDIALMASLGFKHYRFSIAWPRVLREDHRINPHGLDFYKRLLDTLEAHGITPNATLFHWDLPSHLPGGWLSRDTAYRFADYAHTIATALGDRLPRVATFNEPWVSAFLGHDLGIFAPGVKNRAQALVVAHHLMLAHGLGLQAWRTVHADTLLGIVLNPELCDPLTPAAADMQAARMAELERNDCFLNPLFGREWPTELLEQIGPQASMRREGDLGLCAQPLDFVGINYYTRSIAQAPVNAADAVRGYTLVQPGADKAQTDIGWEIYPEGLYRVVHRLREQWPLPALWITENGAADNTGVHQGHCEDTMRCNYLLAHWEQVVRLLQDGVDLRGYYVWSLLDNFEWAQGYSQRFGIVHVDFDTQKRTPKKSARMLQQLLCS
jgi:beta-glucosidase